MNNRTSGVIRRRRTSAAALATLTSAALVLTACGSSDDGGSGGSAPSQSEIAIGSTVSLTSAAASFPEVKQAQEAAVASINAAGGVNGKQLKLTVCDGKFEVNAELGCFRTLLRDKVSAIVGPVLIAGTGVSEYKAAEQAKTAAVGTPATSRASW
ncbi:MAG: ABC transporter substrate-binding protein [Lapillicoccus sp.]